MKKDKDQQKTQTDNGGWTLENALYILQHPTVDSEVWAEAVEYLLLHGPEEIREILLNASQFATHEQFPNLSSSGINNDGEICYRIEDLAKALNMDEESVKNILQKKEQSHGDRHGFSDSDINKLQ